MWPSAGVLRDFRRLWGPWSAPRGSRVTVSRSYAPPSGKFGTPNDGGNGEYRALPPIWKTGPLMVRYNEAVARRSLRVRYVEPFPPDGYEEDEYHGPRDDRFRRELPYITTTRPSE